MTEKADEPKTAEKAPEKAPAKKASKSAARKPAKRKRRSKKSKGGRPKWSPSIEERIAVEQMKFCGESEATIARSLKVDVDTLRKHCQVELADGFANNRRKVTKMLFEAADKGNVSAIKRLDEMGKVAGAAAAMKDRETGGGFAPAAAPEPKPEKPGKKQERLAAAQRVASAGKFQPPAAPRLVVSNAVNE
jgi:hypothetical protein